MFNRNIVTIFFLAEEYIMKFLPQKRWKKILVITVLTLVIVSALLLIYASLGMNNDVITQLVFKNPGGNKTALVLYHPGLSSFSHDVSYAFADGLMSTGWRVELATPSIQAPIELSKYSLLVLASNTYGFNPDKPTVRHLERIGNLEGIETVLITLGAGSTEQSQESLENLVEDSNGIIIKSLTLYSMAPNEGDLSPTEIANQSAKAIK
jgi:hypothetical protein